MTGIPSQSELDEKRERQRAYKRAYYLANKDKIVAKVKKWKKKNPTQAKAQYARKRSREKPFYRNWYLTKTYGISEEQFDLLLKSQNGLCAVCVSDKPANSEWCVDHDHNTGAVRGILCCNCNWCLGHAKDNPTVLTNAINYLKNPPAPAVLH